MQSAWIASLLLGRRKLFSTAVGAGSVQLYVAKRRDVTVLGLGTADGKGRSLYCPLYVSIEGSLPVATLTVSAIDSQQALWVESSLPEAAILGSYHLGDLDCTTQYGRRPPIGDATPQQFGGSLTPMSMPDRKLITRTVTIQYPSAAHWA